MLCCMLSSEVKLLSIEVHERVYVLHVSDAVILLREVDLIVDMFKKSS